MFVRKITVTQDGESFEDFASGNTVRTLEAATSALVRSYELDGATVQVEKGFTKEGA